MKTFLIGGNFFCMGVNFFHFLYRGSHFGHFLYGEGANFGNIINQNLTIFDQILTFFVGGWGSNRKKTNSDRKIRI